MKQLIQREPVRVAYIAIIICEGVLSALLAALEGKPANLSGFALAFVTAAAGELARGRVTPVTVSDEDAGLTAVLGELDNVPAIHPAVEQLEHLIPPEERHQLEGLVTKTAEHELGKAIGLSDADLDGLIDRLAQRGLVVPAAQVKAGDPTETAPEPGTGTLAGPPPIQTEPTPGQ